MEKYEVVKIAGEILEIRVIKDLITEIREDLLDRRKYRREYLSKLDDIIFYLRKMYICTRQKRRGRQSIWKRG